MPTYEYRCKDCGHEFEAVQAFTDDPITECPTCGGTVKKRFGNVGISFKGSGFYKTDTRGSSSSSSSSSGAGSSSGNDAGTSGSGSSASDAGSSSSTTSSSDSSGSTASASA
jgi:putative FmdB family regulatory protein